jgi:hypothetical protein
VLVLATAVILRTESRGTHNYIFLSQIRECPNLEGQVPVFISPRIRVAQLYFQSLGSLFAFSYDSQGYGGGIRPRLHTQFYFCINVHLSSKQIKSSVKNQWLYCLFFIIPRIRCRRNFFTESLPNNEKEPFPSTDKGYTCRYTDCLQGFMKYAVEVGLGSMTYKVS